MNFSVPTPVVLLILTALQAGCIIPFAHEPRFKPDPLEKQAIRIVSVSGRTVTLSDGRTFEVAGLDDRELTPAQRTVLQQTLHSNFPVLVDDLGSHRARLIALMPLAEDPWFESLSIRVCVIHDDVFPYRQDIGLGAVTNGIAKARVEELTQAHDLPPTPRGPQYSDPGSEAAERYRTANEKAQRDRIGVYGAPPISDSSVDPSPAASQPGT